MRVLFWGDIKGNVGPANINKGIVDHLTDRFMYVPDIGKYRKMLLGLWKLLWSDVLVVSGISRKAAMLVVAARLLGKPSVYVMHGDVAYEAELNQVPIDKRALAQEACIMKHASLLLPVSKRYMNWVKMYFSQYADKTSFIYNGINQALFCDRSNEVRQPGTIAVAGGMAGRKNNGVVINIVEQMNGKAKLFVYGDCRGAVAEKHAYTKFMGKLSNDSFLQQLKQTELFVLNTLLESFSIATVEALACGCSILVSERAGVVDLLALEETDLIHDPMDEEEIRGKIAYLMEHPNHERIMSQFHAEEWSFDKMIQRLESHCKDLL